VSFPTSQPSLQPLTKPSCQPTAHPSSQPFGKPTSQPTCQPTSQPVTKPSSQPTVQPSKQPSSQPSSRPSPSPPTFGSPNLFLQIVAGSETMGYTGTDGPATSAMISAEMIWVDSVGNIYVPEPANFRIRRISNGGIITTFGGTGTHSGAGTGGVISSVSFSSPWSIVGTPSGTEFYFTDQKYIWKYSFTTNMIFVFAGTSVDGFSGDNGPGGAAQLDTPLGMWLTSSGALYIAISSSCRVRMISPSEIITTVAGSTSIPTFSGDGGVATSAGLSNLRSTYVNSLGAIFITDTYNHRIRIIADTNNNIITTFAGNGEVTFNGDYIQATAAAIRTPLDVKGDSAGNIFIADANCRVRFVSYATNIISTIIGTGTSSFPPVGLVHPASAAPISAPQSIWIDNLSNTIYVSDGNSIRRTVLAASPTSQPSGRPTRQPIALPSVQPSSQPSIQPSRQPIGQPSSQPSRKPTSQPSSRPSPPPPTYVSPLLYLQVVAGLDTTGFTGDGGAATSARISAGVPYVDSTGNIYIPDRGNSRIRKVTGGAGGTIVTVGGNGIVSTSGASAALENSQFNAPYSIVSGDSAGSSLYFSDDIYIRKYVFATNIVSVVAGSSSSGFSGDGGPATLAQVNQAFGIWVNTAGHLFIADETNHRIRVVIAGIISTFAGSGGVASSGGGFAGDGGPATLATLKYPYTVYVDIFNRLFIADSGNHRIRVVNLTNNNNIISTFAGTGIITPFNGENIPAISANLKFPSDMKGDSHGNIFISEHDNCLVRVVNTNGIISTLFGSPENCGGYSPGISSRTSSIGQVLGLWVDSQATIYFSDHNSIRRGITVSSPTSQPSGHPSQQPTRRPSRQPTSRPTGCPTNQPIVHPSGLPTNRPTSQPSSQPNGQPTSQPSQQPSTDPTAQPSRRPSSQPTGQPTSRPSSSNSIPVVMKLLVGTNSVGYSGDGGAGTLAKIKARMIWVAPSGNIYIPDENNHRIRKFTLATGIISDFGGTSTASTAGTSGLIGSTSLNNPFSIVGDASGTHLYISDRWYVWEYVFDTLVISVFAQSTTLPLGFSGDNGPASVAQLNSPSGLWLTKGGVLYIADCGNHRIRAVSTDGIITTIAGSGCSNGCTGSFTGDNGPAISATLNTPIGVYRDTIGNVFIADSTNNRIRLVDTNNIITTFAGSGVATPFNGENILATLANIQMPYDMKGDSVGNIYLADGGHCVVRKVDVNSGRISTAFGTPDSCGFTSGISPVTAVINNPNGIWVDKNSNVYFSDYNSIHRGLMVFTPTSQPSGLPTSQPSRIPSRQPTGQPTTQPTTHPSYPLSFYLSPSVFMQRVAGLSTTGLSGDGGAATVAKVDAVIPYLDSAGRIYLPDRAGYRIRRIDENGIINTFGGSTQSASGVTNSIGAARFYSPYCIVADAPGTTFYFSDQFYVWKYSFSTNIISVIAGTATQGYTGDNGPANLAQIQNVFGLWFTSGGDLFLTDYSNHRIRKISSLNIIITVAGVGTEGFSGDGGLATQAQLKYPRSIYVNSLGKLFIADSNNNRIRAVGTDNIIITLVGTGTDTPFNGDNLPLLETNLNRPMDVKGDSVGNIFIADFGNCLIRMVDHNVVRVVFGSGTCGFTPGMITSRLSNIGSVTGIFVDSLSRFYFSDSNSVHRLVIADSPSSQPTGEPSRQPISRPSSFPSSQPSSRPSAQPNQRPTSQPSSQPTGQPSRQPTVQPTSRPSNQPTHQPTSRPSGQPSHLPTSQPLRTPTTQPTQQPSTQPTSQPNSVPSNQPAACPSIQPSVQPSTQPSNQPSRQPSSRPTALPSCQPSRQPSVIPTTQPTIQPSSQPSRQPSRQPSSKPTVSPSEQPSSQPSRQPTDQPTTQPSGRPSGHSSSRPSYNPSSRPSSQPKSCPSYQPTSCPSTHPTGQPFNQPSSTPSSQPTRLPSSTPTSQPSSKPSTRIPPTVPPSPLALTSSPTPIPSFPLIPLISPNLFLQLVAGGATSGYSGDGGQATVAQLTSTMTFVDSTGVVYLTDRLNFKIRKIDRDGRIYSFIGTGQSTAGVTATRTAVSFYSPYSVVGDTNGNLFISDHSFIWRFATSNDIVSVIAGMSTKGFNAESGIATETQLGGPAGLWLTSDNVLFVADKENNRIRKILVTTGILSTVVGSGVYDFTGDGGPALTATLKKPTGVYVDTMGRIFIADSENHRVRKVDINGIITTIAGISGQSFNGDGIPASLAKLNDPRDVKGDTAGNIYIAVFNYCRIRVISPSGIIGTLAGNAVGCVFTPGGIISASSSSSSSISNPTSLWVDSQSTVYFTDAGSVHRTILVDSPTSQPSDQPSNRPTAQPWSYPSDCPSCCPSSLPTEKPSSQPTTVPSAQPTKPPTSVPTTVPSVDPSTQPSSQPTSCPTIPPTMRPSTRPTSSPSLLPSGHPSSLPTSVPSRRPLSRPSSVPSCQPGSCPTVKPTDQPTSVLSTLPSSVPSGFPSLKHCPSGSPSVQPTSLPSLRPIDSLPSSSPSSQPTGVPSDQSTEIPSCLPTYFPSSRPVSSCPSSLPTRSPTGQPTAIPSRVPSLVPTGIPSVHPSDPISSSSLPTVFPSVQHILPSFPTSRPSIKSIIPTVTTTAIPSLFPSFTSSLSPNSTERPSFSPSSFTPNVVPSSMTPTSRSPSIVPSVVSSIVSTSRSPTISPSFSPSFTPSSLPPDRSFSPSSEISSPVPTASPTKSFSVIPSGIRYFRGSLFLLGRSFQTKNIHNNIEPQSALPNHQNIIIFGRKGVTFKDMTIGSRTSQGLYAELNEQNLFLDDESRSSTVLGDINADGFDDLLIGFPQQSRCFVYLGSSKNGFTNLAISFVIYGIVGDDFGWAATGIGDYNKDGINDFMISTRNTGVVYLFYGKELFFEGRKDLFIGDITKSDGFKIISAHEHQVFSTGLALSQVGDFNQDGKKDLLMSAVTASGEGIVYLIFGNPHSQEDIDLNHFNASLGFIFKAPPLSFSGLSLTGLGDFNQDGFDDLAIGSLPYKGGYSTQVTYVIFGRKRGTSNNNEQQYIVHLSEMTEKDGFTITGGGFLVTAVNDVNNDGIPDLMITNYPIWQNQPGNAYLIVFPGNNSVSSPPTYFPSSSPSSSPSVRPTTTPSIRIEQPTNLPSIDFLDHGSSVSPSPSVNGGSSSASPAGNPTFSPTYRKTFRPSLQKTSLSPSTIKPSKTPSYSPTKNPVLFSSFPTTTSVPTFPTKTVVPTIKTTTTNSFRPSRGFRSPASLAPTTLSNSSSPPSTSNTNNNDDDNKDFVTIHITEEGQYNSTTFNKNKNILFLIETSGSVMITGSEEAKNIYKFVPASSQQQRTTITIINYELSKDQLDFLAFPEFLSLNDLPFTTNPLTLYLATNYKIILSSLDSLQSLSSFDFIFSDPLSSSKSSSHEIDYSTDLLELMGVLIPVLIVLFCLFCVWGGTVDSMEKEKQENDDYQIPAAEQEEEEENEAGGAMGSDKKEIHSPINAALDPIPQANHNKKLAFSRVSSSSAASHPSRSLSGSFLHSLTGGGSSSSLGSNWLSNVGDEDDNDNESVVPVPTDVKNKAEQIARLVVAEINNANNNFDLELGLPKDVASDNSDSDDLSSDDLQELFGQSDSDQE
jgi:hypothetical protein